MDANKGWENPDTADKYHQYARQYRLYQETSRDLVDFSRLASGMTAIDLACGTGVTTEAILDVLDDTGRVFAVDKSPAMLSIARQQIRAMQVVFLEAAADQIDGMIEGEVDRVLCNSAFWQLGMDKTLEAIRRVLVADGYFAFNFPAQYYRLPETPKSPEEGPSLGQIMLEIAVQEYGLQPYDRTPQVLWRPLDFGTVEAMLKRNGFELSHYVVKNYQQSADALYELNRIPVMTEGLLPDLNYEKRLEILEKAYQRLDKTQSYPGHWAYFVARPH